MKIPVHIHTGFLGVGKTTAVKDLLARRAGEERIAVVVNEFGTLGVDGALLSDCASCILREVPGGCVCCTAMADLEASLEEVCDLVAPTRFVLEPTGLARPSELVDLLRGPRWASRFDVRPVITLLDPQQDVEKSYAESELFRDQVDVADVVVVNRCDVASEEEILRVEEFARALAPPKLRMARTSHGVLPDDIWDLERRPRARRGPSRASAPHSPSWRDSWKGMWAGRCVNCQRIFDAERPPRRSRPPPVGRATTGRRAGEGLFHTRRLAGPRNRGRSFRRRHVLATDSRADVILKNPARDFFEWEERLAAFVPRGAPLTLEDGMGATRATTLGVSPPCRIP